MNLKTYTNETNLICLPPPDSASLTELYWSETLDVDVLILQNSQRAVPSAVEHPIRYEVVELDDD